MTLTHGTQIVYYVSQSWLLQRLVFLVDEDNIGVDIFPVARLIVIGDDVTVRVDVIGDS